jgi:hypothetical protein
MEVLFVGATTKMDTNIAPAKGAITKKVSKATYRIHIKQHYYEKAVCRSTVFCFGNLFLHVVVAVVVRIVTDGIVVLQ